ncbi:MAG: nickel-dependent lactate racemase [Syntrophorhabdaceae bacterium]|nr:nickel-dependent lactate racemase [Syntrophorhabdaceae bacterium]
MLISVPYGKDGTFEVTIDDKNILGLIEPNEVTIGDERETIRKALANPLGAKTLKEFLKNAKDVLIIVNDATRPTPTATIIEFIEKDIEDNNISFLVATGVHRAPTEDEYIQIFSEKYYKKYRDRIFAHDSRKKDEMVFLGTSKNGTEMRINRRGVEADRIVIISSVEPHYFAGYTGGRKSFLPGIASYETIEQNHKLALKPEAQALRLEGNPVHEDMIDALKTVKKEVFAINAVLDKKHRIYAVSAGDIHESLHEAVLKANEVFAVKIEEKADIVVSVVKFPADIDLYQAQKGIDNGKHALKEGGIIILVAKCRKGIGEESFVKLLSSASSPEDALNRIDRGYHLGYHKAAKMAEVSMKGEIWAISDLDPELMKKIFIRPFSSLQDAVDNALKEKGKDAKVLFLMDGSLTIPYVEEKYGSR